MRMMVRALLAIALLWLPTTAFAASAVSEAPADARVIEYPAERSLRRTVTLQGKSLTYELRVGTLEVAGDNHRPIGVVGYTAYIVESAIDRPVTVAMNGGPGSASATLNLGALGPQMLVKSDGAAQFLLVDNPDSWLAYTDLVFLDPVGTGFARSFLGAEESNRRFFQHDSDTDYLAQAIFDWMQANGRMASKKHLVGESYSGYRGPRILEKLQKRLNLPFDGLILVSPLMHVDQWTNMESLPSTTWIYNLPTVAAAELERQGRLSRGALGPIEEFARGEYAASLLDGWRDARRIEALANRLAPMTGLAREYLIRNGNRIEAHDYLREIYRSQRKLANFYDVSIAYGDPFPFDARSSFETLGGDDVGLEAPAMSDLVTRQVGWKAPVPYLLFNPALNRAFEWGRLRDAESWSSLRRMLVENAKLKIWMTHGFTDIACPYFGSQIGIDQISPAAGRDRVSLTVYPGGHVFYRRPDSRRAFMADGAAHYR